MELTKYQKEHMYNVLKIVLPNIDLGIFNGWEKPIEFYFRECYICSGKRFLKYHKAPRQIFKLYGCKSAETDTLMRSILLDHQDINSKEILSAQDNTDLLLNQRFDKIDESLSSIQYEIQELQSRLKLYKEDLLERLKPNLDESLAESYINEFMDTISVRIVKSISKELSNSDYLEEETYLKYIFKSYWDKLSEKSKSFLITARVMFKNLNKSNVEVDYSGVCILLSKSVEVELKRRLYSNFQDYLQEHYGDDYNQWHTVMVEEVNGVKTPLRESRFTLGTIPYLLGLIKIKGLDEYHLNQNKSLLSEFGSNELTVSTDEIESSFRDIAKHIKYITDTYRNPAAHTNILSRSMAQECFDEIVDIQRILVLILRYFKY